MLKHVTYHENEIGRYLELTQGSLFGGEVEEYSEAEAEMLAFIQSGLREK
jgi:hypothetical protein